LDPSSILNTLWRRFEPIKGQEPSTSKSSLIEKHCTHPRLTVETVLGEIFTIDRPHRIVCVQIGRLTGEKRMRVEHGVCLADGETESVGYLIGRAKEVIVKVVEEVDVVEGDDDSSIADKQLNQAVDGGRG